MGQIIRKQFGNERSTTQPPAAPVDLDDRWDRWAERFEHLWSLKGEQRMPAPVRDRVRCAVNGMDAKRLGADAQAVLEFLNAKRAEVDPGKRGYRATPTNLRFIRGRLVDGITLAELKAIVALKCRQARADEFDPRYLRPETLFNATKAEQYLGELGGDE